MSPTDSLSLPGRTMLTSEGTTNRSSHIIEQDGIVRLITPVEAERLNGFPDNWTDTMIDRMRYFCMGNASVVPLISSNLKTDLKSHLPQPKLSFILI